MTFRDIPKAITQGETVEGALVMAKDALETVMEFYFEDKRCVPVPSKPKCGQHTIELPASLSALRNGGTKHAASVIGLAFKEHPAISQPPEELAPHHPH